MEHTTYDKSYELERNKNKNKITNIDPKLLETKPDTNTEQAVPVSKHNNYTGQKVGKFWIKTLNKGKRRASNLGEEDKEILKSAFGSDGEGVSLVDERTFLPDSQGVLY